MPDDKTSKRPVDVTREELHTQVWETPMSRLAEEYGVSGNGLAKICRRMDVPYPPRGWWARKAAGQKVIQYRLPEPKKGTVMSTLIRPTPVAPVVSDEVKEKVETVAKKMPKVAVSGRLGTPHAIIAKWLADHEKRKEDARNDRWRIYSMPTPFTTTDRRRHRILDAMFKAVERNGGMAAEHDRGELSVTLLGEKIAFRLTEKYKQVKIPYENDPTKHRREMLPSGKLLLKLERWLPGNLPQEWLETDAKTMEEMLPDIVATLLAAAPIMVEQTKQRIEAERLRAIAERERREAEDRHKQDTNRWKRFLEIADYWRKCRRGAEFLERLKSVPIDPDKQIGDRTAAEWLAWAEECVERADPINQGFDTIFSDINGKNAWSYRD